HSITGSNPVHRDKDLSSALDSPTNGGSIKECDILRPFTGWLLHRLRERAFPHFEEKTALSYRWGELFPEKFTRCHKALAWLCRAWLLLFRTSQNGCRV
ncbi:TPA: hypothetical protein ACMEXA_006083, partial [Klebsiella variicola subsp. variicola]